MTATGYADFLASKRRTIVDSGHVVPLEAIHPSLFPHQRDLVAWAVRKGRAAIWADTGLGKTRMQIELMVEMGDLTRAEVLGGTSAGDSYEPRTPVRLPAWMEAS